MQDIQELFLLYHKNLYYYLLSLTHNGPLAEDLTSETFCRALQALPNFKKQSSPKTWLFGIGHNVWLQYLHKHGKQLICEQQLEQYVQDTLQDTVIDKAVAARILELLQQKDARTQKVVKLRIEGMPYAQIAQECGLSEGSARVLDFRTKQWLRQQLEKEDYL